MHGATHARALARDLSLPESGGGGRGGTARAAFRSVAVGTTNACKLSAVRRALAEYPEVAGETSAVGFKVRVQPRL